MGEVAIRERAQLPLRTGEILEQAQCLEHDRHTRTDVAVEQPSLFQAGGQVVVAEDVALRIHPGEDVASVSLSRSRMSFLESGGPEASTHSLFKSCGQYIRQAIR